MNKSPLITLVAVGIVASILPGEAWMIIGSELVIPAIAFVVIAAVFEIAITRT